MQLPVLAALFKRLTGAIAVLNECNGMPGGPGRLKQGEHAANQAICRIDGWATGSVKGATLNVYDQKCSR